MLYSHCIVVISTSTEHSRVIRAATCLWLTGAIVTRTAIWLNFDTEHSRVTRTAILWLPGATKLSRQISLITLVCSVAQYMVASLVTIQHNIKNTPAGL